MYGWQKDSRFSYSSLYLICNKKPQNNVKKKTKSELYSTLFLRWSHILHMAEDMNF